VPFAGGDRRLNLFRGFQQAEVEPVPTATVDTARVWRETNACSFLPLSSAGLLVNAAASDSASPAVGPLTGERIAILGPLLSMSRREAVRLVQRHGGVVVSQMDDRVTLVVVGDETSDWRSLVNSSAGQAAKASIALTPRFEVLRETALWRRLGLVEDQSHASQLYTPAMLADLVDAPLAAIKRWRRRGYLQASREVGRLPYFAMPEVHVARHLSGLLAEGCSLARIDKLVAQLIEAAPDVTRPLAELSIVASEGRFFVRRGTELTEPSGQLLLDFEESADDQESPPALSFAAYQDLALHDEESPDDAPILSADQARAMALDLQAAGEVGEAIEACRAALLAGGDVEDHVLLAELLYRAGDLSAARERYYMAIELEDNFVEARASLGCVLAELGELPLAAAAFRGALAQQPDFADAQYHLARTLDELGEPTAAEHHWREFLDVAPASPWAEEATARLDQAD